jgi:hypothetical protein
MLCKRCPNCCRVMAACLCVVGVAVHGEPHDPEKHFPTDQRARMVAAITSTAATNAFTPNFWWLVPPSS